MERKDNCRHFECKTYSLSHFYNVDNEIALVSQQIKKGDPWEKISSYIDNNIYRFLGEFVGKVPFDRIHYRLGEDGFYYDGIASPIKESYRQAIPPFGAASSREQAEFDGFLAIEKAFKSSQANLAFWLSPPSPGIEGFGDYGFLFVYLKKSGDAVETQIVRYLNEDSSFTQSWRILSGLPISDRSEFMEIKDEKDFLRQPLLYEASQPEELLKRVYQTIGFSDMSQSVDFFNTILGDSLLNEWLYLYKNAVVNGQSDEAKMYHKVIYNRAEDLTRHEKNAAFVIDHGPVGADSRFFNPDLIRLAYSHYLKQDPEITGGSCPSVTVASFSNLAEKIFGEQGKLTYKTLSELMKTSERYDDYCCPGCGATIPGEKKSDPSSWTKACPSCGFQFGCAKE